MPFGFIYVWYDRKYHRFYVGSHWGTEDDGYVCSSTWMRNSYRRRPEDFKRRIVKKILTNRKDLLVEEERWLQMINISELGTKFYNLKRGHVGHWSTEEQQNKSMRQKLSESANKKWQRPEERKKASEGQKRRFSDPVERQKAKAARAKQIRPKHTEETRLKMSLAATGRKQSEETKQRLREARAKQVFSEESRQKKSETMKRLWEQRRLNKPQ